MNLSGGSTVPTRAETLNSTQWDLRAAAKMLSPTNADLADPGS
jgi:hypothetical protein